MKPTHLGLSEDAEIEVARARLPEELVLLFTAAARTGSLLANTIYTHALAHEF
jgi:hypothetical protein